MITWPLHNLVKKTIPFEWTEEYQQAFDALKHIITSAPILKTLREDLPYLVETDTSGVALGAVLSQQHDGHWHPINFHSCSHKPAEQNYPAHDAELLAIIDSLKVWYHLLEGVKHDTIIYMDNMVLKYFMSSHLLSHQQVSWAQFLSWFWFKIKYTLGKSNKADGLSRCANYIRSSDESKGVVLLGLDHFINVAVSLSVPLFLECLWHSALLCLEEGWYVQDGLLHNARDQIIMPDDVGLCTEII
jgi:hypothetical protein